MRCPGSIISGNISLDRGRIPMKTEPIIKKLQRDMIGGVIITNSGGEVYRDGNVHVTRHFFDTAKEACPAKDRKGSVKSWEYWDENSERCYQIQTATDIVDGEMYQLHQITDISENISLYRMMSSYTNDLKTVSEQDKMTGLYNKRKYMKLINDFYPKKTQVAVFNMDVNNLKTINDTLGHEAGDRLLIKAAKSIKAVSSDNAKGFRMGGDEFMLLAHDLTESEAQSLKTDWEKALTRLNEEDREFNCVIACGFAYGSGSELEALLKSADERMYEDKKAKKKPGEEIR